MAKPNPGQVNKPAGFNLLQEPASPSKPVPADKPLASGEAEKKPAQATQVVLRVIDRLKSI